MNPLILVSTFWGKTKITTKIIIFLVLFIITLGIALSIASNRLSKSKQENARLDNNVKTYQEGMQTYKTSDSLNAVIIGEKELTISEITESYDSNIVRMVKDYSTMLDKKDKKIKYLNSLTGVTSVTENVIDVPVKTIDTINHLAIGSYTDQFTEMNMIIPCNICDTAGEDIFIPTRYLVRNEIIIANTWGREPAKWLGVNWNWLGIGSVRNHLKIKTTNPSSVITNANHIIVKRKRKKR